MIGNTRVVIVTPAGRRRYMEILIAHVLRLRGVVDEYQIWENTSVESDIGYFRSVQARYPDLVVVKRLPDGVKPSGNATINRFFVHCSQSNTVYVRFDDDIVWIDDVDRFVEFVRYRIDHPEPFLVYANILNNAVITNWHQSRGAFEDMERVGYHGMDDVGWKSGSFAERLHRRVLERGPRSFRTLDTHRVRDYTRVSINCISWRGEDLKNVEVLGDEEQFLSVEHPKALGRPNIVFGNFVVVHYSFFTQRDHLDATDVLARYRSLAGSPSSTLFFLFLIITIFLIVSILLLLRRTWCTGSSISSRRTRTAVRRR